MTDLQNSRTGYIHINDLVGILFDSVNDDIYFSEKIRKISDHLIWVESVH
jgi:hypothetical protein